MTIRLDPKADQDRRAMRAQAERWLEHQARRLDVTPEALDAALRRGWLPEHVEKAEHAAELIGQPRSL